MSDGNELEALKASFRGALAAAERLAGFRERVVALDPHADIAADDSRGTRARDARACGGGAGPARLRGDDADAARVGGGVGTARCVAHGARGRIGVRAEETCPNREPHSRHVSHIRITRSGRVAQLGERCVRNAEAGSSILPASTNLRPVSCGRAGGSRSPPGSSRRRSPAHAVHVMADLTTGPGRIESPLGAPGPAFHRLYSQDVRVADQGF